MVEFEIKSIADLPTADQLWEAVNSTQEKARTRKLDKSDVKSGVFLALCEAALRLCEKYNLDKNFIKVYDDGGAVSKSYKDAAHTSAMSFDGKIIKCGRIRARSCAFGDYGTRYCRIEVSASEPVRKVLKEEGWIDGRYARITEKNMARIIPQPQPTDAVLGNAVAQPQPNDAVLGGKR
jgi:hypothetical protein